MDEMLMERERERERKQNAVDCRISKRKFMQSELSIQIRLAHFSSSSRHFNLITDLNYLFTVSILCLHYIVCFKTFPQKENFSEGKQYRDQCLCWLPRSMVIRSWFADSKFIGAEQGMKKNIFQWNNEDVNGEHDLLSGHGNFYFQISGLPERKNN